MDKLKSFIEENQEKFEDIDLPEGHLERFQKKIQNEKSIPWRQYTLYTLIAAASVTLLFLFTTPPEMTKNSFQETCENREELLELKLYYEMQMFDIVSQMEDITETSQSQALAGLMDASRQVLSATKRFEKNILPELPCSENAMFVINQHYTNSLQSLTNMLEQMQQYHINSINN